MAESVSDSRLFAALAYSLGFITGAFFYFVKKDDDNVRFHATQSMFWFGALWIVSLVLTATLIGILLVPVVGLVGLGSWLFLMYKAYNGEKVMLPIFGEMAEKFAAQ